MKRKNIGKGLAVSVICLLMLVTSVGISQPINEKNIEESKEKPTDYLNCKIQDNDTYGVELSCDDPYQNVKQGEIALYVVKIKNTGTLDDTYEITASSIEDIVCEVNGVNADQYNPYILPLEAGESTSFEVTAEVWESVPKGEWSVIVDAHSQNDTKVYDTLDLTVNVKSKNKHVENIRSSPSKDSIEDNMWQIGDIVEYEIIYL